MRGTLGERHVQDAIDGDKRRRTGQRRRIRGFHRVQRLGDRLRSNARLPVSISNSIAPTAKRSVAGVAASPRVCSGAM